MNIAKVIKFQSPFERLKSYNSCPYIALRKAIILQAVIDATNTSENAGVKKLETEAKAWIFGRNESFINICRESGMEPSFVIKVTKELIKLHKEQCSLKNKKRKDLIVNKVNNQYLFKINTHNKVCLL